MSSFGQLFRELEDAGSANSTDNEDGDFVPKLPQPSSYNPFLATEEFIKKQEEKVRNQKEYIPLPLPSAITEIDPIDLYIHQPSYNPAPIVRRKEPEMKPRKKKAHRAKKKGPAKFIPTSYISKDSPYWIPAKNKAVKVLTSDYVDTFVNMVDGCRVCVRSLRDGTVMALREGECIILIEPTGVME